MDARGDRKEGIEVQTRQRGVHGIVSVSIPDVLKIWLERLRQETYRR